MKQQKACKNCRNNHKKCLKETNETVCRNCRLKNQECVIPKKNQKPKKKLPTREELEQRTIPLLQELKRRTGTIYLKTCNNCTIRRWKCQKKGYLKKCLYCLTMKKDCVFAKWKNTNPEKGIKKWNKTIVKGLKIITKYYKTLLEIKEIIQSGTESVEKIEQLYSQLTNEEIKEQIKNKYQENQNQLVKEIEKILQPKEIISELQQIQN